MNHFKELFQPHGLGDIAISIEIVGAQDVFFGIGSGEDDDGDAPEIRVRFDFGENGVTLEASTAR